MQCQHDAHTRCKKHVPIMRKCRDARNLAGQLTMLNYGDARERIMHLMEEVFELLEVQPEEVLGGKK